MSGDEVAGLARYRAQDIVWGWQNNRAPKPHPDGWYVHADTITALQAEVAGLKRERLPTRSIDEVLTQTATALATDQWFSEHRPHTAGEVERFAARIKARIMDAAVELATPYLDRADSLSAELAKCREALERAVKYGANGSDMYHAVEALGLSDPELRALLASAPKPGKDTL